MPNHGIGGARDASFRFGMVAFVVSTLCVGCMPKVRYDEPPEGSDIAGKKNASPNMDVVLDAGSTTGKRPGATDTTREENEAIEDGGMRSASPPSKEPISEDLMPEPPMSESTTSAEPTRDGGVGADPLVDAAISDESRSCSELSADFFGFVATSCTSCHDNGAAAGGIANMANLGYLVEQGLLSPGDSENSRLVASLSEMPPSAPTREPDMQMVAEWVDRCTANLTGLTAEEAGSLIVVENPTCEEKKKEALPVLMQQCYPCHNEISAKGGVGDVTDLAYLLSEGLVISGDGKGSLLVRSMDPGYPTPMPPSLNGSYPSAISKVVEWIDCQ